MAYSDFLSLVTAYSQAHLEGNPSVTIRPVLKNNGLKLDSLLILYPGENISPTIYLDPYYEAYRDGAPLEDILREILDFYRAHRCPENFDLAPLEDFRLARDQVLVRLVSRTSNQELLADLPHIPFLDLAILFCLNIQDELLGASAVLVCRRHLEMWDTSPQELYPLALANTRRECGFLLAPLAEAAGGSAGNALPPAAASIHVLTNRTRAFGAACLLYEDVLRDFSAQYGSFYVLPSSVHETILVPKSFGASPVSLLDMIHQVNETEVAREDVLSDHLYYYRAEEKKLGLVLSPGSVRFPLRPAGKA